MRWILIAAVLAAAAPARAQDAQTGLDRFRLGMSVDEARAVLPDAEWTREDIPDSGGAVALMTRTPVLIGSTSFAPALEFRGGALAAVRYGRPVRTEDSRDCMTATLQIVRSLEAGGLFDGAHSRTEPDSAPMILQTGAGSVLRAYISSDGIGSTYSNRRGEIYAEVRGRFDSQAQTPCLLTVRLSADPNPPPPVAIDSPTADELAAASHLEAGAVWIEQPGAADFARHYPLEAQRRGLPGRVTLDCLIKEDGYLRCAVTSEEPAGQGFGDAAQQIATRFRMASETEGVTTAGKRITRTIVFRME